MCGSHYPIDDASLDGVSPANVRVLLKTDDGALVLMSYRGVRHASDEVNARMARGKTGERLGLLSADRAVLRNLARDHRATFWRGGARNSCYVMKQFTESTEYARTTTTAPRLLRNTSRSPSNRKPQCMSTG
ncbi:DUF3237 family protein [Peristeroidobacter agariperforans]|uniref:DUF3237 family protein n=1 Tax=Peristeroidobacter agariperforans TaxID=268404 RepID=UPI00389B0308